ncbi:unnamed protein product [Victoria cruziana]
MGIKGLAKLLSDNAPKAMKQRKLESYFGCKIAIDASMSIYQFLIVVGRTGTETLTNEAGDVTSHLQGMFWRTIRLLEAGLKPIYVFDGTPPYLKKQELVKRFSRRQDATDNLAEAKESPSEAEADCASLCKNGKVYAVASEDMDSLTFGAPKFLRHLMDPSSRKVPVVEIEITKVLEELNLSMDQFIDVCILCGCDYCESIRGIGGQTALKLIHEYGSLESVLENTSKDRYKIPENWPYQEARKFFKEPIVSPVEALDEANWASPDEEGLISFLVNENSFSLERVSKAIEKIKAAKGKSSQGRLESFFTTVAEETTPGKRKEEVLVKEPATKKPKPISAEEQ